MFAQLAAWLLACKLASEAENEKKKRSDRVNHASTRESIYHFLSFQFLSDAFGHVGKIFSLGKLENHLFVISDSRSP